MKIGILTFHCAHNYGAVLQAYALQEYLRAKGHEARIIDYRPQSLVSFYKPFDIRCCLSPKTFISKSLLLPLSMKRAAGFERFIRTRLRPDPLPLEDARNGYDVFVFGSDQIWNPDLLKGFDKVYFGDFKAAGGRRLVAYAASMGKTELMPPEKEFLAKAMRPFHAVSVREESLQRLLSSLSGKPVAVTADPTLLLDRPQWDRLAALPSPRRKPYVLVYQVVAHPNALRIANRIARQAGGEVVELKARLSLLHRSPYQCISPEEFVGYFKHAACVVTTSFHGTAFSVIFRRPFCTVRLGTHTDVRSEALLGRLGLEDRLLDKDALPGRVLEEPIDWASVDERLQEMRGTSEAFLRNALRVESKPAGNLRPASLLP